MISFKLTPKTGKFLLRGVPAFLALLLLFGCGTLKQEKKLEKDGLTLMFRTKTKVAGEVEKLKLAHPAKFSQDQIINHLLSLRYEELSFLGREKYVYSRKDVEAISRLITKALNRVPPNKVVYFELDTPSGSTVGDIFATQNKIHWRYQKIKGVDFSGNPVGWRGNSWRLVPKKGQEYHVSKRLLGKKVDENWIVADYSLPFKNKRRGKLQKSAKPRPANPTTKKRESASDEQNLENKLKFLKDLHEKNLVDDEEYERKRKELLDQYL